MEKLGLTKPQRELWRYVASGAFLALLTSVTQRIFPWAVTGWRISIFVGIVMILGE
jgi:hypothetical protein